MAETLVGWRYTTGKYKGQVKEHVFKTGTRNPEMEKQLGERGFVVYSTPYKKEIRHYSNLEYQRGKWRVKPESQYQVKPVIRQPEPEPVVEPVTRLEKEESRVKEILKRDLTPTQRRATERELGQLQRSMGKTPEVGGLKVTPATPPSGGAVQVAPTPEVPKPKEEVVTVVVGDKAIGVSPGVAKKLEEIKAREEVEPARQKLIKEMKEEEVRKLSFGQKALLGASTVLSPKAWEVAYSPIQSLKTKKPVKDILMDIGVERLEEARVERTPAKSFIWGATESMKSPAGVYLGSQLVGGIAGGVSQAPIVSKIASTKAIGTITTGELGKIGFTTLAIGETLKTGKTATEHFK
ncbi:MAG: hypothetical protein ACTSQE_17115, partial [Candidatus Heimdallarchaeaceae archaeon]